MSRCMISEVVAGRGSETNQTLFIAIKTDPMQKLQ